MGISSSDQLLLHSAFTLISGILLGSPRHSIKSLVGRATNRGAARRFARLKSAPFRTGAAADSIADSHTGAVDTGSCQIVPTLKPPLYKDVVITFAPEAVASSPAF